VLPPHPGLATGEVAVQHRQDQPSALWRFQRWPLAMRSLGSKGRLAVAELVRRRLRQEVEVAEEPFRVGTTFRHWLATSPDLVMCRSPFPRSQSAAWRTAF
jgi:hypothetical protein